MQAIADRFFKKIIKTNKNGEKNRRKSLLIYPAAAVRIFRERRAAEEKGGKHAENRRKRQKICRTFSAAARKRLSFFSGYGIINTYSDFLPVCACARKCAGKTRKHEKAGEEDCGRKGERRKKYGKICFYFRS